MNMGCYVARINFVVLYGGFTSIAILCFIRISGVEEVFKQT